MFQGKFVLGRTLSCLDWCEAESSPVSSVTVLDTRPVSGLSVTGVMCV